MITIDSSCAPSQITAFMTTAENGATFSPYDGHSYKYYDALSSRCGQVVTLHQVHSAEILRVTSANRFAVNGTDGDGLFTTEEHLPLGILTADCYPVLLAGDFCIAALHCGWRGAVGGIIKNASGLFRAEADKPDYAFVGAGISVESFEVKKDFIDLVSEYIEPSVYLALRSNKWYFDLQKYIVSQLEEQNITHIEIIDYCTFKNSRFHSYRREGSASGRMISVIMRNHTHPDADRTGVIHRKGVQ